jgi:integrase/recombinase XerD
MNNPNYTAIEQEYTAWLDTLGYSESIQNSCRYRIRDFFAWLEKKQIQDINRLTDKHLCGYRVHLETRPNKQFKDRLLGAAHINWYFFALDKLLEFLHQYGMTALPVSSGCRIKTDRKERILQFDVLTQQEIKTLYSCIPDTHPALPFEQRQAGQYELKLIFALYYGCGLRRSEGCSLQLQDVDFDKKTIFVKQGKGCRDRIVPMSTGVYKELQDYIYNFRLRLKPDHSRLFIWKGQTLYLRLKHLQNICGDQTIKTKRITLHMLRHSIATHLLQNGMSIENIALFLGHGSLDSTQIYTHLADS